MKRLRRLARISLLDWQLFCMSAWLLVRFEIALRLSPNRVLRSSSSTRSHGGRGTPAQIGWAVRSSARVVPGATCLVQALAATSLLSRAGRNPRLQLGVANPEDAGFSAHAWVECDGLVIIGAEHRADYRPLPTI